MSPTASSRDSAVPGAAGPSGDRPQTGGAAGPHAVTLDGLGTFRLEIVHDLAAAEGDWRALEARGEGHPFQSHGWMAVWYETIGRKAGIEPVIAILRDTDGQACLLLPLGLERGRLGTRIVALGDPVCDYHGPLVTRVLAQGLTGPALEAFWAAVLKALPRADLVALTRQPPWLGTVANPLHALASHAYSAGAHGTRLGADWETFYAGRRGTKTRRRFREKERRLEKFGPVTFEAVSGASRREALAGECLVLKSRQLDEMQAARNPFSSPDVQAFFRAGARRLADADGFHLFRLSAGGETVAAALCLVGGGSLYYIVPVYQGGAYQRCSPGALLLHRIMQWSIERGCTRFDFTIGDEGYKADWADESWTLGYGVWPVTPKGHVAALAMRSAIALKRWIKSRPAVFALVRRALALKTRVLGRGGA